MTELSHDAGEDAFHEIQLSGKQLVFLFMMTTVISVLIFLCGVMVGRGVHAETASASGISPASQSEPVATAGPGSGASSTSAGQVADRTPPPSSVAPPAPPAEGAPPLSYPNTLQSAKPPTEELKAPAADSKKTANAEKPATSTASDAQTRTSAPPASSPASALASSVPAPGATKAGVWAVQVVALTDRAAATAVVQRLSSKGYPAFLVNPQAGAPVQNYKVQVGRYADRAEAEQVKTRLKKEEQFEPWILR